jgi:hypothetical protein
LKGSTIGCVPHAIETNILSANMPVNKNSNGALPTTKVTAKNYLGGNGVEAIIKRVLCES